MSQKTYVIVCNEVTVAGATSLIVIRPPASGTNIEIVEASVSQADTTTSEQIAVALGLKASAFQTVTSFTPLAMRDGGTASVITGGTSVAAGTCGINASAEGAGTFTPLVEEGISNINGWRWVPMPDSRIVLPSGSSNALALKLMSTPTGTTGWCATLIYREV